MKRRHFIQLLALTGFSIPAVMSIAKAQSKPRFFSAQGSTGSEVGIAMGQFGEPLKHLATGFRGHAVLQHINKPNTIMMFARRPGYQAVEINVNDLSIKHSLSVTQGRNFQGHGCFTLDGQYLLMTESDNETGQGYISVRDANDYRLLGDYMSQGIGPHELKVMPDGKTLVIANGGILTRPKTGRKKLNLADMNSSLTYIDIDSGVVLDQFKVTESKSSIRHLDVSDDGSVVFAMQNQRDAMNHNSTTALAGVQHSNSAIQLMHKPEAVILKMNDYMGSVALNNQTRIAGFTSPRGDLAAFWHIDSGEFLSYHRFHDVCGIAVASQDNSFLLSNSNGQVRSLNASTLIEDKAKRQSYTGVKWDNHLISF